MSNDVVQLVAGSQYFAVAGVVILIYNHILSFEDEVEYIWRAKSTAPKLLFLILRYIVPSSIIWHTHQLTGISHTLSPDYCQRWFISVVCLCVITTGPLHFFVMLRLWVISERNKRLVFGTLAFFLITEIAIVACGIAVGIELRPVVTRVVLSNNNNQTWCVLSERRIFWIMSLPGMLFEAVALFAMCFNVTKITASGKGKIYNLPSQHGIECVVTVFFLKCCQVNREYTHPGFCHVFICDLPMECLHCCDDQDDNRSTQTEHMY